MNRGRRNLKQAASEQDFTLEECQSIAQVVSLRGSNQIEIMDAKGENSLALFPAKFRESMWIRRGSFVVIDHTGKEKAQESGSKVTSIVCKVLFFEQVRLLQKSPEWPEIFKDTKPIPADESSQIPIPEQEDDGEDDSSDDDDGMPPLEANTNRLRPFGVKCDAETDSESDSDS
ncbi:PREDICTED: probable RNA-binding protein EIF1AD [Camelina sativa]|uniref:Probable RNA-binding protein EIF1AD n=1 Tax=Camelina sativa TaxID=90675 RepID=A0ABM0YTY5_CAMSA|nr:PREDICTED: probable RNA-binding protein EIF1AD [Camelina sativa]